MDRCPICHGRINDNAECKRCNADLLLLIQTEIEAKRLTHEAFNCLLSGKYIQAEAFLSASQLLCFSQFKQNVLEFIQQKIML
ncbi:hypothetical protein MNBD_GAMMA07-944 [hydrothermal vent metagenome]|uniref:Uncharacterized protein n=1 Tax=hydrothermal vent metagenome TaxID=652676 RepID=A0A3B0WU45_9ZZZZ